MRSRPPFATPTVMSRDDDDVAVHISTTDKPSTQTESLPSSHTAAARAARSTAASPPDQTDPPARRSDSDSPTPGRRRAAQCQARRGEGTAAAATARRRAHRGARRPAVEKDGAVALPTDAPPPFNTQK